MFGPPKGGAVLDEFESGFSRFNNVHSDILTTYECRGLHSCAVCYPSCLKSPPHHLTSCLIHTDWTQSLLLRRTARPRMFQTTGGIVDMPLELAGTLRLFHENLPVCCVLAFVCDSLFWCECTERRWHCFGTARWCAFGCSLWARTAVIYFILLVLFTLGPVTHKHAPERAGFKGRACSLNSVQQKSNCAGLYRCIGYVKTLTSMLEFLLRECGAFLLHYATFGWCSSHFCSCK